MIIEFHSKEQTDTIKETESFILKSISKMLKFQSAGGKLKPMLLNPTETEVKMNQDLQQKNIEAKIYSDSIGALAEGKRILLIDEGNDEEND